MDDTVAVKISNITSIQGQTHTEPRPALIHRLNSGRRTLTVGTLEVHFLLLLQSLSHPSFAVVDSSVVILLTCLAPACPFSLSRCGP